MVTTLKNEDGYVIALCEWRLVGASGYEVPNGEYIWINDMWVHEDYRHIHKVNRIIDEIMCLVPEAKYAYFQRKNKNERLRIFTRAQWERRRNTHDIMIKKEK